MTLGNLIDKLQGFREYPNDIWAVEVMASNMGYGQRKAAIIS